MLAMDRHPPVHRGAGLLSDVFQKALLFKKVQGTDMLFPGEMHTMLKER